MTRIIDNDISAEIVPSTAKVSRAEAAKILGVSKMTIRRLQTRGQLTPIEVNEDGHHFFARADVEALKGDEDEEVQKDGGQAIIQASVELVKTGLENAKRSAELYFAPSERAFQQLMLINDRLMSRNAELEKQNLEHVKAMQDVFNEQHLREQDAKEREAKLANRQHMLKEAMKTFPWIAVAVAEKFGLSPVSQKLMHFLSVLDGDKLKLMLESDMVLSDTEKAALQDLLRSAGVNADKVSAELPEGNPAEIQNEGVTT